MTNIWMDDGEDKFINLDKINTKEIVSECVGCDSIITKEIRAINRLYDIQDDYECIKCLSDTLELPVEAIKDEGLFWVYVDQRKCLWDD